MRIFYLLLLLPVFLQCGQKEMSLPLLTISENKRFVINENGEPFFWLGDTGWLLLFTLTMVVKYNLRINSNILTFMN